MLVSIGPPDAPEDNPNQERSISIQIDSWDTWSLDHTLALIILPSLKEYRKVLHGYPSNFSNLVSGSDHELQMCFDFYKESVDDYPDVSFEAWKMTVDKMIWSFEQIVNDQTLEEFYTITESKVRKGKTIDDMFKPVDPQDPKQGYILDDDNYYEIKQEIDWQGRERHEELIQEGIDLFAKYYKNLWD